MVFAYYLILLKSFYEEVIAEVRENEEKGFIMRVGDRLLVMKVEKRKKIQFKLGLQ